MSTAIRPKTQTTYELLSDLVSFPSVSDDLAANHEALNYVAEFLEERGMFVQRFEPTKHKYEVLIASTRPDNAKNPKVLLAAHIDVMPASPGMFRVRKQDGKYFGRGVHDMKCSIAAYMKIVDKLQGSLQNYDFAIMLTSDEEIGGRDGINGTQQFIKAGYIPDVVVLPDGGQDWQLENISNGYMHVTLQATGKTAHSSRPWLGNNAVEKLIGALDEIRRQFTEQGPDTDTGNIATISSPDIPANQVPDFAESNISFRLKHAGRLKHWRKVVGDICKKYGVEVIERAGGEVTYNDLDNPYVRRFADLTEQVTGEKVIGFHSYAGSDARFYAEVGVPYANAYPRGGGHHSENEWLDAKALDQLEQIVYQYVLGVAAGSKQEASDGQKLLGN
jgi:succinyl-diaminopimelate desuccinylase